MGTLPVRPVTTQGTWRVNYRLGDDMVIRLPRVPETGGVGTLLEHGLLLRLARFLPAAVPELIGRDGRRPTIRARGVGSTETLPSTGLGDPSQGLTVAWMLLPAQVRPTFRRATGVDDATWLRGRARALSIALGHLDYYRDLNPVMADNARYTIREVLDDYSSSG